MPRRALTLGGPVGFPLNPSIHILRRSGCAIGSQLTRSCFLCLPFQHQSNPNQSPHVWRLASEVLVALNALHRGRCDTETSDRDVNGASNDVVASCASVHTFLLNEAASLHRARRGSGLTGALALSEKRSESVSNSLAVWPDDRSSSFAG